MIESDKRMLAIIKTIHGVVYLYSLPGVGLFISQYNSEVDFISMGEA